MSTTSPESLDTESYWRSHVEHQSRSGLSVREYCQQEGFSQASFYNWRKRLQPSRSRSRAASAAPLPFLELTSLLARPAASSSWQMEVTLPNGTTLRLARDFDPAALAHALQALARC
jgi:transposase-like protein